MKFLVFVKEMYQRFFTNRVLDMSATVAFYFLLSLFPLLLFLISLLSFLPIQQETVLWVISEFTPGFAQDMILNNIRGILAVKQTGLLTFGIIFTMWSALSGIESLVRAVNFSYGITKERTFLRSKMISFALTAGMTLVILSAFILTIFGEQIEHYWYGKKHEILFTDTFRLVLNFVILYNVFSVLYLIAPLKRIPYREVIPGTLFASGGWYVLSLGFSFYVEHFSRYSTMYGSLTGIMITLFWFYLSALILLLGGQLNAVLRLIKIRHHKH